MRENQANPTDDKSRFMMMTLLSCTLQKKKKQLTRTSWFCAFFVFAVRAASIYSSDVNVCIYAVSAACVQTPKFPMSVISIVCEDASVRDLNLIVDSLSIRILSFKLKHLGVLLIGRFCVAALIWEFAICRKISRIHFRLCSLQTAAVAAHHGGKFFKLLSSQIKSLRIVEKQTHRVTWDFFQSSSSGWSCVVDDLILRIARWLVSGMMMEFQRAQNYVEWSVDKRCLNSD